MIARLAFLVSLALALPIPGPHLGARVLLESPTGEVREVDASDFETRDPRQAGGHLVRFVGLRAGVAPSGAASQVRLASGDRLSARVRGGEGERLNLELLGGVRLALGVESLRSLRFEERIPIGWSNRLEPAPEGDRLYRKTGWGLDRIDGTLIEFSAKGLVLDGALGEKLFEWTEVAALFVEVFEQAKPERSEGDVPVIIDLSDFSRLAGTLVELNGTECKMRFAGTELSLPTWTIAELLVDDGRLQFLSDRTPDRVEERSPFGDDLGMQWPYRVDRSVTGEPLRVDGETFTRGLGVHAPSRLTWRLEGDWEQLRGRVALDDQVKQLPAHGSALFRVLLDGEKVWESAVLRGGDRSVALPAIELKDAEELTLEVDMATEFHVADRADWIRVLLSR